MRNGRVKVKEGHLSRRGARESRAARFGRRRVGENHPALLDGDVNRLADPEAVRREPTARHAQVRHACSSIVELRGTRRMVIVRTWGRASRSRLARAVRAPRGAPRHAYAATTRTREHRKLLESGGGTGAHLRHDLLCDGLENSLVRHYVWPVGRLDDAGDHAGESFLLVARSIGF